MRALVYCCIFGSSAKTIFETRERKQKKAIRILRGHTFLTIEYEYVVMGTSKNTFRDETERKNEGRKQNEKNPGALLQRGRKTFIKNVFCFG
jgi:hypothetical protein